MIRVLTLTAISGLTQRYQTKMPMVPKGQTTEVGNGEDNKLEPCMWIRLFLMLGLSHLLT